MSEDPLGINKFVENVLRVMYTELQKQFTDWTNSSERERRTKELIEELSDGHLNCAYFGYGAGRSDKIEDPKKKTTHDPLDIGVYKDDKIVAFVEVSGSDRYRWNMGADWIPVVTHKADYARKTRELWPSYIVWLTADKPPKIVWLNFEVAEKAPADWLPTFGGTVPQHNHFVPKTWWNPDIRVLVEELMSL